MDGATTTMKKHMTAFEDEDDGYTNVKSMRTRPRRGTSPSKVIFVSAPLNVMEQRRMAGRYMKNKKLFMEWQIENDCACHTLNNAAQAKIVSHEHLVVTTEYMLRLAQADPNPSKKLNAAIDDEHFDSTGNFSEEAIVFYCTTTLGEDSLSMIKMDEESVKSAFIDVNARIEPAVPCAAFP